MSSLDSSSSFLNFFFLIKMMITQAVPLRPTQRAAQIFSLQVAPWIHLTGSGPSSLES